MAELDSRFAICHINDIPSRRAQSFILARRHDDGQVRNWLIFVIRWGKRVVGYENACPHEGTPLDDMEPGQFFDADGLRIQCCKHGALFDLGTGECVDGPCVGACLTPVELIVDEDGDICVVGVALEEDDDYDSGEGCE
jgi:nitrite reductase/ring-hydroxylating ferredoxin subunit